MNLSRLAGVREAGVRWRNPECSRGIYDRAELVVAKRLVLALAAYVALAALAFATLPDQKVRAVTLAILAMFAVKTWVRRKDVLHPDDESQSH
jgi:hypothetical protein